MEFLNCTKFYRVFIYSFFLLVHAVLRSEMLKCHQKKVIFQSCMEVGDILNFLKQPTSIHCDLVSQKRVKL